MYYFMLTVSLIHFPLMTVDDLTQIKSHTRAKSSNTTLGRYASLSWRVPAMLQPVDIFTAYELVYPM